ncbi:hypothetical protein TD95_004256 [Thielaviopsis punctulata]|uniref:Mitochondrial outer membrane transport complex Sam37/metaxin N-terminal domain-containing protein n=1 Tax=Thielaviopsis punctulata TaxID=72032 RepID=A0A0F4Z9J4_9PEZI|nr:hypothetical protein TD95_004256 [Thielaviopsis punctulata]
MPDCEYVLHIWGPAFGLASIDAECLAAVTLIMQSVSREGWKKWQIVANSDASVCPSSSPADILPALYHDSSWICGYRAISRYLASSAATQPGLPAPLNPDAVAFTAWMTSKTAVLLDLSLYVSSSNWVAVTRPAYSSILPWPLTWSIPPVLRRAAIARAERQGFVDMEGDMEDMHASNATSAQPAVPTSFNWRLPGLKKKMSVLDEMSPEQQAGIRLYSYAKEVLDVISKHSNMFRADDGHVSAEGCLAYAYLSLFIKPAVPQPWLKRLLTSDYPKLIEFINHVDLSTKTINVPTVTSPRSTLTLASTLAHQLIQNIPELGDLYLQEWKQRILASSTDGSPRRPSRLLIGTAFVAGIVGSLTYYVRSLYPLGRPLQVWSAPTRSRLGEFGELGAMLGLAMGGARPSVGYSSLSKRDGVVEDVSIDL